MSRKNPGDDLDNLKWWVGGALGLVALLQGLNYYDSHKRNSASERPQSWLQGPAYAQPVPQSQQQQAPSWREEYERRQRAENQKREWQNLSKIPTENLTLQQAVWKAFYTRHFENNYEKASGLLRVKFGPNYHATEPVRLDLFERVVTSYPDGHNILERNQWNDNTAFTLIHHTNPRSIGPESKFYNGRNESQYSLAGIINNLTNIPDISDPQARRQKAIDFIVVLYAWNGILLDQEAIYVEIDRGNFTEVTYGARRKPRPDYAGKDKRLFLAIAQPADYGDYYHLTKGNQLALPAVSGFNVPIPMDLLK